MAAKGSSARARQRARELLVQALYQWQLTGHDEEELKAQFKATAEFGKADGRYFEEVLHAVLADVDALDGLIRRHAARSLEQLDVVGRGVLLLGLAELKHRLDVPTKVVINEAVNLAKRYGAAESFKFVNAVLDKTAREMGAEWGRGEGCA
ncbi:MAG TPA: transcription antitermination factor NusB [Gammaproteobacteria bacterium]